MSSEWILCELWTGPEWVVELGMHSQWVLNEFSICPHWILHELTHISYQAVRVLCWDNIFLYKSTKIDN